MRSPTLPSASWTTLRVCLTYRPGEGQRWKIAKESLGNRSWIALRSIQATALSLIHSRNPKRSKGFFVAYSLLSYRDSMRLGL